MRKILILLVIPLVAIPASASPLDSPLKTLQHYYHAINAGDYRTAYEQWMIPRQTLEAFSAGFADTQRVEPYFGELQVTLYQGIPAVLVPTALVTTKTDGRLVMYYGCFLVSQPFASSDRWVIDEGNFALLDNPRIPPTEVNIRAVMDATCNRETVPTVEWAGIGGGYAPDLEAQMLIDYYTHINAGHYQHAYDLWLQPIPGPKPNGAPPENYRPPYNEFVNGYANTEHVMVYPGIFRFMGAAAGKPYLKGELPVVLVSENTDGSFEVFAGCYVIGGLATGGDGIVDGAFVKVADGILTGSELLDYTNYNCTSLNLRR